jgi:hypothetical protein
VYHITTASISTREVHCRFGGFEPLEDLEADAVTGKCALALDGIVFDRLSEEPPCPTLFVWLHEMDRQALDELALCPLEFHLYSEHSAAGPAWSSWLALVASTCTLVCDAWDMDYFPSRDGEGQFRIVLVSGDVAAVATHTLDDEAWFALVGETHGGEMGVCAAHRIWPSRTGASVAASWGSNDPPSHRVIVAGLLQDP